MAANLLKTLHCFPPAHPAVVKRPYACVDSCLNDYVVCYLSLFFALYYYANIGKRGQYAVSTLQTHKSNTASNVFVHIPTFKHMNASEVGTTNLTNRHNGIFGSKQVRPYWLNNHNPKQHVCVCVCGHCPPTPGCVWDCGICHNVLC